MAEAILDSPIGPLRAVASATGLQRLEFLYDASKLERRPLSDLGPVCLGDESSDVTAQSILDETERQLEEYFSGSRRSFDLPLEPSGSDFQMRVWQAIASIPYGEVLSYGELAAAAGSPGAFRAAGSACGVNRITVVIPCHRVVGANRALGGYGGGLEIKRALLRLEGSLAGLRDAQGVLAFV